MHTHTYTHTRTHTHTRTRTHTHTHTHTHIEKERRGERERDTHTHRQIDRYRYIYLFQCIINSQANKVNLYTPKLYHQKQYIHLSNLPTGAGGAVRMDTKAEDHPTDLHNTTPRDLTADAIQAVSTDRPVTGPTAEWPASLRDVIVPVLLACVLHAKGRGARHCLQCRAMFVCPETLHYPTCCSTSSLHKAYACVYTGYTSSL